MLVKYQWVSTRIYPNLVRPEDYAVYRCWSQGWTKASPFMRRQHACEGIHLVVILRRAEQALWWWLSVLH